MEGLARQTLEILLNKITMADETKSIEQEKTEFKELIDAVTPEVPAEETPAQ
jgi:hypothetical protein